MIYLTGDTHGNFTRIKEFCDKMNTKKEDILIILGDAGVNFNGGPRDKQKKDFLKDLPVTLFCIHGNHERRPETIETYKEVSWNGGTVYREDEYPSINFAKDGEIYELDKKKILVIGGAYSADKQIRLLRGWLWFPDEQPSEEIKERVENKLDDIGWKVDIVLSHTTPLKYEPIETFISGIDQSKVDTSTEEWLDKIEEKLDYRKWYCGHFHTAKKVDKLQIMFEDYDTLNLERESELLLSEEPDQEEEDR